MQSKIKVKSRIDEFEIILNIPPKWNEEKIIIGLHGFDSSKDSESIALLEKDLENNGIAFARFTLPYHAERRINPNDLTVDNCLEDIYRVESEIKERYPKVKIGIFAVSFGSYLTLLRMKKKEHNFFLVILRSPALKMDEILKNSLIEDNFSTFKNKGYTIRHRKTDMKVNYTLYEELKKNKLSNLGTYNENIIIFHGKIDDTAPCQDVINFAKLNTNVKLFLLENENHKMNQQKIKKINKYATIYFKSNNITKEIQTNSII